MDPHGNRPLIIKSIVIAFIYFTPFIFMYAGLVPSIPILFLLYVISGLGMAGVGMCIMHDALHQSFSNNRTLNRIMGYSINLIGANASIWKIQHNVLHHTYTNVDHADDDIEVPGVLRFSPEGKKHWFHRYQHVYVWFFYGLMTMIWVTVKDFIKIQRYRKMGFLQKKHEVAKELAKTITWKIIFFSYALVLPIILLPYSAWIIVLAFLGMHFITGICLSIVFQVAHVMPTSEYQQPDEKGNIPHSWASHQLTNTVNFAPKSRILTWLIGGLNYQIEHHLMPNISHVHYRNISPIVEKTAREYGLPYHKEASFLTAIKAHMNTLKYLGRN